MIKLEYESPVVRLSILDSVDILMFSKEVNVDGFEQEGWWGNDDLGMARIAERIIQKI